MRNGVGGQSPASGSPLGGVGVRPLRASERLPPGSRPELALSWEERTGSGHASSAMKIGCTAPDSESKKEQGSYVFINV